MGGGGYVSGAASFLVQTAFGLMVLVVMLRFLLQTVRADFYNPLSQFVVRATNPVLVPMRRVIPGLGGVDLAAVLLMLALKWLELTVMVQLAGGEAGLLALLVLAVAELLELAIFVFIVTLMIQVIMSWVNPGAYNPMTTLLHSINEPLLRPARRVLPPMSGLDLSPLAVFVVLNLARFLLVAPIRDLAVALN